MHKIADIHRYDIWKLSAPLAGQIVFSATDLDEVLYFLYAHRIDASEMNVTGKDTNPSSYEIWTPDVTRPFVRVWDENPGVRPYCVVQDGVRFIDVRDALVAFPGSSAYFRIQQQREAKRKTNRWYLPYWYQHDSVPRIGKHFGKYGRRVRHWFRAYRQDRIPEYERYVRKKGRVEDMWCVEPVEGRSRSWKDNTKYQKQWMAKASRTDKTHTVPDDAARRSNQKGELYALRMFRYTWPRKAVA